MMLLGDLLHDLPGTRLRGPRRCSIQRVVLDSRMVQPGDLFAALEGERNNGKLFVDEAVHRGAVAVLSDPPKPPGCNSSVAWVECEHPRRTLAQMVRRLHGAPDARLSVVGITGTDGKTTTAHLLSSALFANGIPTAISGTLGQSFGRIGDGASLTTPEAPEIYAFLSEVEREGAQVAALEVSSAGLVADRTYGMRFVGAVLTGIGHDHLDLHGSQEAYLAAKRTLFEQLGASAFAVLPRDCPEYENFARAAACPKISFGLSEDADWRVVDHSSHIGGASFRLVGPDFEEEIHFDRPADWDALNLAAAVAAAAQLGADPSMAARGAAACPPIPGRWEVIDEGQPFAAIVDYAHTPQALERALRQLRGMNPSRVILVFGCGGDRDRDKRPLMGRIAAELADLVILTDDNPRQENPEQIARETAVGLREGHAEWQRIASRAEAIAHAVAQAQPGQALLVAGKGHETWQEIGHRREPFDDREVLAEALRTVGARS
ncbi:MAG TPA: UDP-N-acetylmuramoyl-L-alanyl-D-glutamate--2,6-diaminopimelate ligase [Acidobacteria bacterium]|nr:UDP-N-acetylmuramoyl-L-alanyl-D-glutamate--2,6-diaminopimelate ligase [Acidobacteriota bacterium]